MIIHLTGQPIVLAVSFHHALHLMRGGQWACVRSAATGLRRWSCFAAALGL